jgi:hypothetical protein
MTLITVKYLLNMHGHALKVKRKFSFDATVGRISCKMEGIQFHFQ